jgi:hypothetical protein
MEHSTLYDEKRTLVDKVLDLTEQNHLQDQLIMKILKMVNQYARDSQNPLDRVLRDRIIDEVLKAVPDVENKGFTRRISESQSTDPTITEPIGN